MANLSSRRKQPERVIAALAVLGLIAVDGVGLFQVAVAAAVMALVFVGWDKLGDVETSQREPRHIAGRIAVAAAMLVVPMGVTWLALWEGYRPWRGAANSPSAYVAFAGGVALLSVSIIVVRGRTRFRDVAPAGVLGMVAGSGWVVFASLVGLANWVRLHPRALEVLVLATLVGVAADSFRRGKTYVPRLATFTLTAALSVCAYWIVASGSPATLGYHSRYLQVTDPSGRLDFETEPDGKWTNLWATDKVSGDRLRIYRINTRTHAGIGIEFKDEELSLDWYETVSTHNYYSDGVAQKRFDYGKHARVQIPYCPKSEDPLICMRPPRAAGSSCEMHTECESSRCISRVCVTSTLGEPCTSDEFCDEGACIGRVCRVPDGDLCDSEDDCPDGYCIATPNSLVGQCYRGEVGDPCNADHDRCRQSTCVQRNTDVGGTCVQLEMDRITF